MTNLANSRVIVTGGSAGLGLAMVGALAERGADVTAIARDPAKLGAARDAGARTIVGDATDAALINSAVADIDPDVLILNAGARLPLVTIDQESWDSFSSIWNTDVKATLVGIQAALNTPMKPGSRVMMMSSGAATVMSSPFIQPESLRLSGGYIGAKRMVWYMAHQANVVSRERELGIHFQALLPSQLIPGTALGHAVASAYGEVEGRSVEEHVLQRYGSILDPDMFGRMVADLVSDPSCTRGVAYGFRVDAGIMPLDVVAASKRANE